MNVLYIVSEVAPFSKTGGLGDVAGALPKYLSKQGVNVSVMSPLYRRVRQASGDLKDTGVEVEVTLNQDTIRGRVFESRLPGSDVPVYFLENERYYDREELYGTSKGDFPDNCERFVFFCRGVMEAIKRMPLEVDLIHSNDWQTGLIPVYVKTIYKEQEKIRDIATLFTIHNIAYQGLFWHWDVPLTGLSWDLFNYKELEFFGKINLLKGGIVFSDIVTTVSRTYAKEIQTPEFGCGLEGVLAWRSRDLHGILNGVDYSEWNPETDRYLPANYSAKDFKGKRVCKQVLQKRMGLPANKKIPLLGFIGRLTAQKGLDILAEAMDELMKMDVQFVLLGSGEQKYQELLQGIAQKYRGKLALQIAFDIELSHIMQAGCDIMLVPSQYEPCGLNQMYSMKYATVPLARKTGGLADTIVDATEENIRRGEGTGFLFEAPRADALIGALSKALTFYRHPEQWKKLMLNCTAQDWSWNRSAAEYVRLYEMAIQKRRRKPS